MPGILDKPSHWLERAEEARTIAEQLADPEAKKMMLGIADSYDRLAKNAQIRLKKSM
jgi:hypothetical protein